MIPNLIKQWEIKLTLRESEHGKKLYTYKSYISARPEEDDINQAIETWKARTYNGFRIFEKYHLSAKVTKKFIPETSKHDFSQKHNNFPEDPGTPDDVGKAQEKEREDMFNIKGKSILEFDHPVLGHVKVLTGPRGLHSWPDVLDLTNRIFDGTLRPPFGPLFSERMGFRKPAEQPCFRKPDVSTFSHQTHDHEKMERAALITQIIHPGGAVENLASTVVNGEFDYTHPEAPDVYLKKVQLTYEYKDPKRQALAGKSVVAPGMTMQGHGFRKSEYVSDKPEQAPPKYTGARQEVLSRLQHMMYQVQNGANIETHKMGDENSDVEVMNVTCNACRSTFSIIKHHRDKDLLINISRGKDYMTQKWDKEDTTSRVSATNISENAAAWPAPIDSTREQVMNPEQPLLAQKEKTDRAQKYEVEDTTKKVLDYINAELIRIQRMINDLYNKNATYNSQK